MGEVIAFIVGAVFGVLSTCLIAAGRRGDDIQNMSIKQRNVSEYPEYEYDTHNTSMAGELIRAQGEQIKETPAEYVARKFGIRSDADGQEHTE